MLTVCEKDQSLHNAQRDVALLRLLYATGMRASELAGIRVEDMILGSDTDYVWVTGKGDKSRRVPFDEDTGKVLDRYERVQRAKHPYAALPDFFLGKRGGLNRSGIYQIVTKRAEQAGVGHVNVHQFRHDFADRALSIGMSEGDLMRHMGWSKGSRSLLHRYGSSRADRRAYESYRRLFG